MENSPTDSAKKDIQPPSTSSTDQAKSSPPKTDIEVVAHTESSSTNTIDASTTDTTLPPPPRPASNAGNSNNNNATNTNTNTTTTSDTYFAANQAATSHLSFEPNPFEHSFAGGGSAAETPGGTKLPPVASITSPASLLPNGTTTPYPWGTSSLRTGPLSPAMLSGPTGDYFSDTNHLRGGFTPNESSLRTGLTPGGGGSMFPAPSPTSQALFSQLAGGATPSTLDFHRTALSAAAQRKRSDPQLPNITSQPQQQQDTNGEQIRQIQREPFAQHDANDAANGLFLLASQSRTNSASAGGQYAMAPQQPVHAHPSSSQSQQQQQQQQAQDHRNGGGRALSEASDESERASRPNTRGKGRKSASARRKAEEPAAKAPPSKKGKGSSGQHHYMEPEPPSEEEDVKQEEYNANGKKMTDEEKRKNFLERNRVAALKCRQRKKQWLANLQSKVEIFSSENDALSTQISALREEVVALKTLLLAHKDCPVTQSQAMGGYLGSVEFGGMPPGVGVQNVQYGMMPQGMGSGMGSVGQQQQQVMAGQGGDRRFS